MRETCERAEMVRRGARVVCGKRWCAVVCGGARGGVRGTGRVQPHMMRMDKKPSAALPPVGGQAASRKGRVAEVVVVGAAHKALRAMTPCVSWLHAAQGRADGPSRILLTHTPTTTTSTTRLFLEGSLKKHQVLNDFGNGFHEEGERDR